MVAFGKSELIDSFTDGVSSLMYFPAIAPSGIPGGIRKRTEENIRLLVRSYESENGCTLDTSKLCLCARLVVCRETGCEINIVISGADCLGMDVWIEGSYKIVHGDPLYGQFKSYFMAQVEKGLFGAG